MTFQWTSGTKLLKYYIIFLSLQLTKPLNQFFYFKKQTKTWKLECLFGLSDWKNYAFFIRKFFIRKWPPKTLKPPVSNAWAAIFKNTGQYLNIDILRSYLKKCKILWSVKTATCSHTICMTVICNKIANWKVSLWIPARFQFFSQMKQRSLFFLGKILWHYD